MDDFELLQAYAKHGAEEAFAAVVRRHLNLVYSSALRQTRRPDVAEEITQAVFIILARKAATIRQGTILAAWLLRTTRYTVANVRRREQRRYRLEREAIHHSLTDQRETVWDEVAPLLDEAMLKLREKDRNAITLHFFEQKTFKEVGWALGLTENNARMRVGRALQRLRQYLGEKDVTLSAATLASLMDKYILQATPGGVSARVIAGVAKEATEAVGSVAGLVKETLSYLAWLRFKAGIMLGIPTALLTGLIVYVAPVIVEKLEPENLVRNGDFEQGLANWQTIFWEQSQGRVTVERVKGTEGLAAKFSVRKVGLVDTFEFVQGPIPIKAGHKYTLSFRARSTASQSIRIRVTKDKDPWTLYGYRAATEIGPRWRTYRLSDRALLNGEDGRLVFRCRGAVGDVWLDNIKFQDRGT